MSSSSEEGRISSSGSQSQSQSSSQQEIMITTIFPNKSDNMKEFSTQGNQWQTRKGKKRLFVGNLSAEVTCEDLNLLFQKYGKIVEIAKCTNFAYVEFSLDFQASHALEKMKNAIVNGKPIRVEYAIPKIQSKSSKKTYQSFEFKRSDLIYNNFKCRDHYEDSSRSRSRESYKPIKHNGIQKQDKFRKLCFACGQYGHFDKQCYTMNTRSKIQPTNLQFKEKKEQLKKKAKELKQMQQKQKQKDMKRRHWKRIQKELRKKKYSEMFSRLSEPESGIKDPFKYISQMMKKTESSDDQIESAFKKSDDEEKQDVIEESYLFSRSPSPSSQTNS